MRGNTPPETKWKFLAGHKPTVDRIEELGWSAVGPAADFTVYEYSNRDGPACQRRWQEFTFRADFDAVAGAARREAAANGGHENAVGTNAVWLEGPSTAWRVIIKKGRRENAGLVHITAQTYRNENFLGVARRWLRASFR